ncbi:MAG: signal peptidase I [Candidatus Omnitrophota bacterium]|nr:signal peptidase I [Candidatus Omnitrophota bacterium]
MEEAILSTIVIDCKREAIKKGLKVWFPVKGSSMTPLIRGKDRIAIMACCMNRLKPGDMIVFQREASDRMIAHRIIKKIKEGAGYSFITKGDSSLNCDRLAVLPYMVLGKISDIQKPGFKIYIDSLPGKILNMFMLMLSLSRIIYLGRLIWIRIKLSSKHKADHCHQNNFVSETK